MKKLLTTLSILLIATVSYAQTYTVERVIDGDTIKLTNGEEIELIGVNAPNVVFPDDPKLRYLMDPTTESVEEAQAWGVDLDTLDKMGQEATEFVKSLGIEGKDVHLEFDVQERDKYGRLLAYVFIDLFDGEVDIDISVPENFQYDFYHDMYAHFINATIIKAGYATPMTIPPNVKYADLFKELYEEARWEGRGLWKEDTARNNIEIQSAHQTCNIDDDCTTVEIECISAACECGGQPIHKKFLKKYTDKLKKCRDTYEAIYGYIGVCDMDCPQLSDKCLNGVCTVVDTQTGLPFRIDE